MDLPQPTDELRDLILEDIKRFRAIEYNCNFSKSTLRWRHVEWGNKHISLITDDDIAKFSAAELLAFYRGIIQISFKSM